MFEGLPALTNQKQALLEQFENFWNKEDLSLVNLKNFGTRKISHWSTFGTSSKSQPLTAAYIIVSIVRSGMTRYRSSLFRVQ